MFYEEGPWTVSLTLGPVTTRHNLEYQTVRLQGSHTLPPLNKTQADFSMYQRLASATKKT